MPDRRLCCLPLSHKLWYWLGMGLVQVGGAGMFPQQGPMYLTMIRRCFDDDAGPRYVYVCWSRRPASPTMWRRYRPKPPAPTSRPDDSHARRCAPAGSEPVSPLDSLLNQRAAHVALQATASERGGAKPRVGHLPERCNVVSPERDVTVGPFAGRVAGVEHDELGLITGGVYDNVVDVGRPIREVNDCHGAHLIVGVGLMLCPGAPHHRHSEVQAASSW